MAFDLSANPKLKRYQDFLDKTLAKQLADALAARDALYERIADHLKLGKQIGDILARLPDAQTLDTLVNLGSNFYGHGHVPDTSIIHVHVGKDCYPGFTLPEALDFIAKREKALTIKAELLTGRIAELKTHMRAVTGAIAELLQMK